ncbi:hypothetical protein EDI_134160 [Entamoeba dispar SAW760]|uniref:RRM domain-containing protein n=1 Tax=Entamoeba dispar (strain ATCC PRA-260 / SAW760) TaxID=370354 RepID=B0EKG3_ENTDS|nr:uncharacterized protein EDI_134160 [Entamoeba dispar SAW760]EDR25001.1 hypothetical protein EDI_134160 [Entamoeba dispar SAW760]|eukprot:EDR25001.1 hypothetical protein EDI_134160 [Entamoeba dispar SAW760]
MSDIAIFNLKQDINEDDLKTLLQPYGKISEVKRILKMNKQSIGIVGATKKKEIKKLMEALEGKEIEPNRKITTLRLGFIPLSPIEESFSKACQEYVSKEQEIKSKEKVKDDIRSRLKDRSKDDFKSRLKDKSKYELKDKPKELDEIITIINQLNDPNNKGNTDKLNELNKKLKELEQKNGGIKKQHYSVHDKKNFRYQGKKDFKPYKKHQQESKPRPHQNKK